MLLMQNESPDSVPGEQLVCVQTTYGDAKLARQTAKAMVEQKLAACVQSQNVSSNYVWQGQVEEDAEVLLTAKTTLRRAADLEVFLRADHPYDEPEFIVLPVIGASDGYAKWVRQSVAP